MRCKCCDTILNEWECKAKEPTDRTKYLDLCSVCRYHSNPYKLDDEEIIKKDDLTVDSS